MSRIATSASLGLVAFLAGCATATPDIEYRINQQELTLFADSGQPISETQIASFQLLTGRSPIAWGRYLCNPAYDGSFNIVASELSIFVAHKIAPLLIIEPQQNELAGKAQEASDEEACVVAQIQGLRASTGFDAVNSPFGVFLAVEKGRALSAPYLREMISDLKRDGIINDQVPFGVYLHGEESAEVRRVVNDALNDGFPIASVWYARYRGKEICGPPPYWQDNNIAEFGIVGAQSGMLQYAKNCHAYGPRFPKTKFDLDMLKPPFYDKVSGILHPGGGTHVADQVVRPS